MEDRLLEYAKLVVRVGVNIQKGQTLVLACPVECAAFGRMVAEEAYEAGAREVVMRWSDDATVRMKYLKADDGVFDEVPEWLKSFYNGYADIKAGVINIYASDPENLKGVSPDRLRRNAIAMGTALKDYQNKQMASEFPWCIVSMPTPVWASKVFPGIPTEEAVDKLWDAILAAVRVSGDGTAIDKWQEHLSLLSERAGKLNDYRFTRLVYRNSLGTDLTVELPEKHKWTAGRHDTGNGAGFVANMPTEEIFTLPKKNGVNGVLYSSLPLSLSGNVVKGIKFTFKDGKIVEADAKEGLEYLLKKLDTDEGARYLGEVALVPYDSPISNQKILYYNTLFDENASCHFAFGKAYPTLEDAENITEEELKAIGANDSVVHEDFMVGTPDLSITGITSDGNEIPVFVNGNFAF